MSTLHFKPAAPKYLLIAIAGILWSIAGIMLCKIALVWLLKVQLNQAVIYGLSGIILAYIAYRFMFIRTVQKNINRIIGMSEKSCIFAFQSWKSYIIIIVMVTIGLLLRHSPVPESYLAVIRIGMGGALFLSSIHYYAGLLRLLENRER